MRLLGGCVLGVDESVYWLCSHALLDCSRLMERIELVEQFASVCSFVVLDELLERADRVVDSHNSSFLCQFCFFAFYFEWVE